MIHRKVGKDVRSGTVSFLLSEADRFSERYEPEESITLATDLILHPLTPRYIPNMVIEGAPGQGKSTIAQYVCQVHRIHLLDRSTDIDKLPEHHRKLPLRLPIKVDLRDLAAWLSGRNPWRPANAERPTGWEPSLESFLAALIKRQSGGYEFSVSDLAAVCTVTSVLFVLDGLDEVADFEARQQVVDATTSGIQRLSEVSASLQVVVTTRPAAFANSPGMPSDRFAIYHLASLPTDLIQGYAERWLRCKDVDDKEAQQVRNILSDKLDQPHFADLARNPMQLAILLSLIHARGVALPDKRTALYASYMDHFFSREAEKTPIVRDQRDLLMNVHGFLAWKLQAQAEEGGAGSIGDEELRSLVREYLERESYPSALLDDLFKGMVERVVAIVSRVEGTFEFEVQPLREYFAAKYLYDTAPYSPTGQEKSGTLPERFSALARNFYWLNVARFYAGFYSIGELPSLVDSLQELLGDAEYRLTTHPRFVSLTLLADWVFAQHPKSVHRLMEMLLAGGGITDVLEPMSLRHGRTTTTLTLPEGCGREELVIAAFDVFRTSTSWDHIHSAAFVLRMNVSVSDLTQRWWDEFPNWSDNLSEWLYRAGALHILESLPFDSLAALWREAGDVDTISYLSWHLPEDTLLTLPNAYELLVDAFLDGAVISSVYRLTREGKTELGIFMSTFEEDWLEGNLANVRSKSILVPGIKRAQARDGGTGRRIADYLSNLNGIINDLTAIQLGSDDWSKVIEAARNSFGDRVVLLDLLIEALAKFRRAKVGHEYDLFDATQPLCLRGQMAIKHADDVMWWRRQFEALSGPAVFDQLLISTLLVSFSANDTLYELQFELNGLFESLSRQDLSVVQKASYRATRSIRDAEGYLDAGKMEHASARTVAILHTLQRASDESAWARLREYNGSDHITIETRAELSVVAARESDWDDFLLANRRAGDSDVVGLVHSDIRINASVMPLDVAVEIRTNRDRYNSVAASWAETRYRQAIQEKLKPVGRTAADNNWFDS